MPLHDRKCPWAAIVVVIATLLTEHSCSGEHLTSGHREGQGDSLLLSNAAYSRRHVRHHGHGNHGAIHYGSRHHGRVHGLDEGPIVQAEYEPFIVQNLEEEIRDNQRQGVRMSGNPIKDAIAKAEKPLMNQINVMRAKLCWMRPDLWEHQDCLDFLGVSCRDFNTGSGVCRQFREGIKKRCAEDKGKGKYCEVEEVLGIQEDREEEEEEKAEEEAPAETPAETHEKSMEPPPAEEDEAAEAAAEMAPMLAGPAPAPAPAEAPKQPAAIAAAPAPAAPTAVAAAPAPGPAGAPGPSPGPNAMPDLDGDGIPDVHDPDIDGDGTPNDQDWFPRDGKEWSDMDGDGIGDNSDPDIDGDGYKNEDDPFPLEATGKDSDGDGVPDFLDDFPDDPTEHTDTDGDGLGDNVDIDRDGDGVVNSKDAYPNDSRTWMHDADFDGVPDDLDAFPLDPDEHEDTDGDGVGDNMDPNPIDPNCFKAPCKYKHPLSKKIRHLPEQGYDEHSDDHVKHDHTTHTDNWSQEFSDQDWDTLQRICQDSPNNKWCQRQGHVKTNLRKVKEKASDSEFGMPSVPGIPSMPGVGIW